MERRKILLGSGAVFATVLAGCSDSTSDDDGGGGDTGGDQNDDSGDDDYNDDDSDDIPGFDKDKVKLDHTDVKVDDVKRDGYHVEVEVTLEGTLEEDELYEMVEDIAVTGADAIEDPEKLLESVEILEFAVYDNNGELGAGFYLDVDWAVAYARDNMSEEELVEKAMATA